MNIVMHCGSTNRLAATKLPNDGNESSLEMLGRTIPTGAGLGGMGSWAFLSRGTHHASSIPSRNRVRDCFTLGGDGSGAEKGDPRAKALESRGRPGEHYALINLPHLLPPD
jgi:hypothetical protein